MEVRIQAIHFDATEKLQDFIQKKTAKLEKYCDDINKVEVSLKVVKPETAMNKEASIKVLVPNGEFFAENDGTNYELHVNLTADDMTLDLRDELISVSKSGKNAAAKGVMGKIRAVVETMLLSASDPSLNIPTGEFYDCHGYNMGFGYINSALAYEDGYLYSWSLYSYKTAVKEKEEDAYAELERSIVAKLADDIIVGVRGNQVEIIVKKAF